MIIAVDIGLKRLGVAQYAAGVALPLDPILRKNRHQAARDLDLLLKEKGAQKLVAGIPKEGSSSEEMERRIRHFIGLLEFRGEVCFVDESYSSKEAFELLRGRSRDRRDGKLDSLSALVILERYLGSL
ncbi:Holliday junction resolvase RuvX [Wolinella succinogenes]|uniref:YqgF/RNase H-like domain-containing protein n=1 Tax=Wolinella succinogenes (strain ATCC 29543 / DSM 1740 / CCUG 13145 / JCM 31913 / LMG 7466 / NCTC 11488 / FDC 602W) TaxID=273121 RepID=Q7MQZ1_WOLSU|nr:Holliday junction resolvase RuvX [Wolinella succinogenes]CAE10894.1 conserved hypothetical protein-Predicted endonuclease [Wolinella succinogenes]VEG81053.1 Putative Holliday junction resolvase [Wolinella succinogenes]HCZ18454.1 Holliday junction resolvase RuvX [Helicobacter sp.]